VHLSVQGTGPAVVLVPSLGRARGDFDELRRPLIDAGFCTVAVDPRGTDGQGLDEAVTLHDLAADVAAVIESTSEGRVHLVGHALGNRISRCVVADRPDLVASLTLLAAGGLVEPAEEDRAALRRCFDLDAPADAHRAAVRQAFFATDDIPASWLDGWYPAVAAAQSAAVGRTDRTDWWSARAPATLVVQGLQDRIAVPENGRRYVAEIGATATLVEIDGAGHALLPEQPDAVADALIDFLGRVTSPTSV
jgi:pimeloyl-ACP methyl ester carboxylesterase